MTAYKNYSLLAADFRYWLASGLTQTELEQASQLPVCQDPQAYNQIPLEQLQQIYGYAFERLNDPYMSLRIGQNLLLSDISKLQDMFTYIKDGWQLVEVLSRYFALISDVTGFEFVRQDSSCELQITLPDTRLSERHVDCVLSGMLRVGSLLLGLDSSDEDVYIGVSYACPGDEAEYQKILGCKVRFNQTKCFLHLPNRYMQHLNPSYDLHKMQAAVAVAEKHLQEQKALDFVGRIETLVAQRLAQGVPLQQEVASHFNMSVRNLQRRLQARDTSYREVVDQVRCQQAKQMIAIGQRNMTDIAGALGFEETNSFFKAFKRWTGVTPGDYRKSLAA